MLDNTNMTDDNEGALTIDGKLVTAPKGSVVVDAAKSIGIEIPVFCYQETVKYKYHYNLILMNFLLPLLTLY